MKKLFRVWDVKGERYLPDDMVALNSRGVVLVSQSGWYADLENTNPNDYLLEYFTDTETSPQDIAYETRTRN